MNAPKYAHEYAPGDRYESLIFTITPEVNQQFLYSLEDFDACYIDGADGESPIVHPVLLLHMSARTRSPSFKLAPDMGSIFARDNAEFLAPAHVDRPLTVNWQVLEVYHRKGRLYQSLGIDIHDDGGRQVLKRNMHSTFFRRAPDGEAAP